VDTSHIEFVEVEMSDGSKETISKFPLEPYYRKYGALFEWERNPWKVADYPGDQGGRSVEAPGIAISFPYWFGKYLGVMEERD
jgi:hypothetical protein